ncbi:Lipopolysaccharide export system protein LptA [Tepidimonas alkaliphilus]|uniref:Lipopolysaccharide export system protein LptA n=1 Tax=Tepidimonas alkaliphilus TaxID=2588942 RepID=A0A554W7R5_9BURK|nr:lipopolysaccharide transport periplasmic protein LptA [Tepidimonas alkaliphilus]TSE19606.1 Lipopolysaccharide export system protein LptA [Tepidimonas alkaliphilus]
MPALPFPRHWLVLLALGAALVARAEQADRQAPMHVEADALRYDEARRISLFTGNVQISKGTIRIRAQQVEVRQDEQGHQFGVAVGAPGQRAFYRQKRDGVDEWIEGEAQRIEYDGQADRVTLRGDAELRRLRGTVLADRSAGAVIVYDNRAQTLSVDGAPGGASGGRVRATLTPRAADPTAQQPTPDVPPPALQPSLRPERRP